MSLQDTGQAITVVRGTLLKVSKDYLSLGEEGMVHALVDRSTVGMIHLSSDVPDRLTNFNPEGGFSH